MAKRNTAPKYVEQKLLIGDVISNSHSELESLGGEMREWADNLEEKFSATEKYSNVSEAADTLEGLSEPDVPESLQNREFSATLRNPARPMKRPSRADRRDEAVAGIDAVMSALEEIKDDESLPEELRDEAETLWDDLDNYKGEAEGVEFPGMYG